MYTYFFIYTLFPFFFQVVAQLQEGLTKRCTALAEQIQQGAPAAAERQAAVEGAMKVLEARAERSATAWGIPGDVMMWVVKWPLLEGLNGDLTRIFGDLMELNGIYPLGI